MEHTTHRLDAPSTTSGPCHTQQHCTLAANGRAEPVAAASSLEWSAQYSLQLVDIHLAPENICLHDECLGWGERTDEYFGDVEGNDERVRNVDGDNGSVNHSDADIRNAGNYENDDDNDKYSNATAEAINFKGEIYFGASNRQVPDVTLSLAPIPVCPALPFARKETKFAHPLPNVKSRNGNVSQVSPDEFLLHEDGVQSDNIVNIGSGEQYERVELENSKVAYTWRGITHLYVSLVYIA